MIEINIIDFIPEDFRNQISDTLVDFLSAKTKDILGQESAKKIENMRSDASFRKAFGKSLERALIRFYDEYEKIDEDLVNAIITNENFFKDKTIQVTLIEILKHPDSYLSKDHELLIQSFASVFPYRKNRERVNKAIDYLLRCLAKEIFGLPEFQPIYSLQFQKMTAQATHEQVEIQKAQLHALTSLNSNIRETLLQLTDTIAERKLLTMGEEPSADKGILHNLPQPDYNRFFGRQEEKEKILEILKPYPQSQEHLITIDGIGGVGKTALALETAYYFFRNYQNISANDRFEAIVWVSAKKQVLTSQGIRNRSETIQTLKDVYSAIAAVLDWGIIERVPPEDQKLLIRNELIRTRTLIIIDNLESLDDEALINFLNEVPAPTKVIVTTRQRLNVAYPIRLKGMPWIDGSLLIRQLAQKHGVNLKDDESLLIYERTGGVPLAIVWSIAQLGRGSLLETVMRKLRDPQGDVARFCFEGAMDSIRNKMAGKALLALSLFSLCTDRNAIATVAGISDEDCNEALVELEELSLVNRQGNLFDVLPLTREYAYHELQNQKMYREAFQQRFASYYSKIKVERIAQTYNTIDAVHLAYQNLENLRAWKSTIRDYFEANRDAIKRRRLNITRIFVLERTIAFKCNKLNQEIIEILNEQSQAGIKVYILWTEDIIENKLRFPPDLIIFDRKEVHVHLQGQGGFYTEVDVIIKEKQVRDWYEDFILWQMHSQPFPDGIYSGD